jgi:hypothetical protein
VVAASPDVKAKVPAGWSRLGSAPQVPGLGLADSVAFAPGGKDGGDAVVLGAVRQDADNSTLLAPKFISAVGSVPPREAVQIGAGLQAYRYRNVRVSGFGRPVTVYAVPTSAGVATLACLGAAATCDGSANTMSLVSAKSFPVGPSEGYAKTVGAALRTLSGAVKSGHAKLTSAKTPAVQASAAQGLSTAYAKAASALSGLSLSPADTLANARLAAALKATSSAYGKAAQAASHHNKSGYAKAARAVTAGRQTVSRALTGLKNAGYAVKP